MSAKNHRSLIVTADDRVTAQLEDRLGSLGHSHDRVATQADARNLFSRTKYCYVLLDLDIPVRRNRTPSRENGVNLLEEFRSAKEECATPIIVLSTRPTDSLDLAVEVMQRGAVDFLPVTFTPGEQTRTVDSAIKNALRRGCSCRPEECVHLGPALTPPSQEEQASRQKAVCQGGDVDAPKAETGQTAPGFLLNCNDRIHFDGSVKTRRTVIVINGVAHSVPNKTFALMLRLALKLTEDGTGWVRSQEFGEYAHHAVSNARKDLQNLLSDPKAVLFENDGYGSYRLSISPKNLSFDWEKIRAHWDIQIASLAKFAPATADCESSA